MNSFTSAETVGDIVARQPSLSRVFEKNGIDYCCAGKRSLDEVCLQKGLDAGKILALLNAGVPDSGNGSNLDVSALSLTELADHIVMIHHDYLRDEFPRLDAMTNRVAHVHGDHEPRLLEVRDAYLALQNEMTSHMMKEESILFPMIRQLEAGANAADFHCGSLANPIRQMEAEHAEAGSALERMNSLTDGFTPPEWACNTYRAMLSALAHLESDLHRHVHKENNVLFPRALALEAAHSG